MDWSRLTTNVFTGFIGGCLVLTTCAESFFHGTVDPAVLTLSAAVVATYFTGAAVRQVNGSKVDALTTSVMALHSRLDQASVAPARDGATPP